MGCVDVCSTVPVPVMPRKRNKKSREKKSLNSNNERKHEEKEHEKNTELEAASSKQQGKKKMQYTPCVLCMFIKVRANKSVDFVFRVSDTQLR